MMALLPAVSAMPSVHPEFFHASEHIAEIASYLEASLGLLTAF